jgi:dCMP deaminase
VHIDERKIIEYIRKIALYSPDEETKVGCALLDHNGIIVGTGWNRHPVNKRCSLPTKRPEKYPYMIHAEIAALVRCRRPDDVSVVYITHSPCHECAKALAMLPNLLEVVYVTEYQGVLETIKFLEMFGVIVRKYEGENA